MPRKGEIVVRMDAGRLVPASGFDRLSLLEVRQDTLFVLEPYRDTRKKVRYFHTMLGLVAENAFDDLVTKDHIKGRVFSELGFVKGTVTETDGTQYELRLSINDLSSEQIDEAIERLLLLAELDYCPGIDVTTLKNEAKAASAPAKR